MNKQKLINNSAVNIVFRLNVSDVTYQWLVYFMYTVCTLSPASSDSNSYVNISDDSVHIEMSHQKHSMAMQHYWG